MGELQRIQDFLSYTLGSNQSSEIRVFTDNQAALQALQNFNKCSKSYIMQTITQNMDDQRIRSTPIQRHWISAHTNIKRNEEVDIAAKEATGWRHMKKRNGKWKNWDSGYTTEKHVIKRTRVTIRLASEQKTLKV